MVAGVELDLDSNKRDKPFFVSLVAVPAAVK